MDKGSYKVFGGKKLVKDYTPKYKMCEVILVNTTDPNSPDLFKKALGISPDQTWQQVLRKWGTCPLVSVCDYSDTKTTSLIILKKEICA